jgi:hypothetical protein
MLIHGGSVFLIAPLISHITNMAAPMTKAEKALAKIMAKKAALKASQEEEEAAVAAAAAVKSDAPAAAAAGGRAPAVAKAAGAGVEDSTRHTNGVLASREASKDIKIIQFSMSAFGTLRRKLFLALRKAKSKTYQGMFNHVELPCPA